MVNLHIHSKGSHGKCDYKEIISMCVENQYSVISITDHNIMYQQEKAQKLCIHYNIKYIFGVEISAMYNGAEVHFLAYFKENPPASFSEYMKKQNVLRALYMRRIEVNSKNSTSLTNVNDIIDTVHQYGGIAILAHLNEYKDILDVLVKIVDGLELIHSGYDLVFINYLYENYKDRNLLFTAGTDFYEGLMDNEPYYALVSYYKSAFEPFIQRFG